MRMIIEAVHFDGGNIEAIQEFCGDALKSEESNLHTMGYFLATLEGSSYLLSRGDWVIKGIKGEFYPCKNDVFEATYEAV